MALKVSAIQKRTESSISKSQRSTAGPKLAPSRRQQQQAPLAQQPVVIRRQQPTATTNSATSNILMQQQQQQVKRQQRHILAGSNHNNLNRNTSAIMANLNQYPHHYNQQYFNHHHHLNHQQHHHHINNHHHGLHHHPAHLNRFASLGYTARQHLSQQRRHIRLREYKNLRQVIPSLRIQRTVSKVEVVSEAARYIDHLHKSLLERFVSEGIPDNLRGLLRTQNANQLKAHDIMDLVAKLANSSLQQHQQMVTPTQSAQAAMSLRNNNNNNNSNNISSSCYKKRQVAPKTGKADNNDTMMMTTTTVNSSGDQLGQHDATATNNNSDNNNNNKRASAHNVMIRPESTARCYVGLQCLIDDTKGGQCDSNNLNQAMGNDGNEASTIVSCNSSSSTFEQPPIVNLIVTGDGQL